MNYALLSYQNCICTFMRCGHLTYDSWIWLKVTCMASKACNRKSAKKIHKIVDFWWFIPHSRIDYFVAKLLSTSSSVSFLMKLGYWGHYFKKQYSSSSFLFTCTVLPHASIANFPNLDFTLIFEKFMLFYDIGTQF